MSLSDELVQFREMVGKLVSPPPGTNLVEREKALKAVGQALDQVRDIVSGVQARNPEVIEVQVTEWSDVNRTLAATAVMEKAILDSQNGIEFQDVVETMGKGLRIAVAVAKLLV